MRYDDDEVFNSFKDYFPRMSEHAVRFERVSAFDILIEFDDGDISIYDSMEHTIRNLPRNSSEMTEEECRREFGIRLRTILYRRGITQAELSSKTGISQTIISNYINGKNTPSLYAVDRIAKALGCSVDEFRYVRDRD